ncbi:suppressor of lurcher protein 1-like isoform X2 [Argiope bruennichi]|uniref:suppressor of lurcher protein 1-like isoform X2 n=1 Tax=Argiope bruennichi TaxID=94029 RepID=UPI0024952D75|nr:suppressor of lurcher protein 1-like isoform X2 [Argiope bruennichi]
MGLFSEQNLGKMKHPFVWWFALCSVSSFIAVDTRRETKVPFSCGQEFSSDVSKNGTFTSPNYPEPYPADVYCVYSFMGRGKERVQIQFTDFDLHLPHEPPRDCDSVDAVMVFITINGQKDRVDNFCGNKLPAQLMSNGPSMSVEFRSLHSSPEVKGFRAIYKFVTDFGIYAARQDSQSVCGFNFNSEDRKNGTFTSPNYPGYYPRNTECHYFFKGKPKERVHITFNKFDVDGIPPCTTDTASDYVEFSNFRTVDRGYPRHCGVKKPKYIESQGEFFRVTFKSNDKFDGTGFEALYHFKPYIDQSSVQRISSTSTNSTSSDVRASTYTFILVPVVVMLMINV